MQKTSRMVSPLAQWKRSAVSHFDPDKHAPVAKNPGRQRNGGLARITDGSARETSRAQHTERPLRLRPVTHPEDLCGDGEDPQAAREGGAGRLTPSGRQRKEKGDGEAASRRMCNRLDAGAQA